MKAWQSQVEYELWRGAICISLYVTYDWEPQELRPDAEGEWDREYKFVVEDCRIMAWYEVDQQGNETGAEWECDPGVEIEMLPELLPPMSETEQKDLQEYLSDQAACAAEDRY